MARRYGITNMEEAYGYLVRPLSRQRLEAVPNSIDGSSPSPARAPTARRAGHPRFADAAGVWLGGLARISHNWIENSLRFNNSFDPLGASQ
ncbi:hypothetical protein KBY83_13445 [Cyanobium sp. WKJ7-Wakatipu]|uniref:hypothetical protein n=1 Tax=Cyanobium sp. WKJ7-Wakatipu TaxID=2823726 RepID=UPI0020CF1AF3|nr:hypothetical protein [Cyanobium sp. WKJ7-Wakatipu]MCP9784304.1 hypothetical protein [Cyanobium sp. WKJ7-Wakatipu]